MNSKIEVREFAVKIAAEIMGKGTPVDSLIAKAQEIEDYIVGGAMLPEVAADTTESLVDGLKSIIGGVNDIAAPMGVAK
jgi:hypothetical protein